MLLWRTGGESRCCTTGDRTIVRICRFAVACSIGNFLRCIWGFRICSAASAVKQPLSPWSLCMFRNDVVLELEMLQKLADSCNIQVPMEVVNLIDDGKNPDEFTRDAINSCIARNQVTKGKTNAFKSLRKHLLEELEQAFPEEMEVYREIRATSAAESKRLAQAQSILPNGDMKINSEH